jgi:hypothetical protein
MSGLAQREDTQMDINCPSCHSAIFDAGDKYVCEKMDQCPGGFKVWGKIAGYVFFFYLNRFLVSLFNATSD